MARFPKKQPNPKKEVSFGRDHMRATDSIAQIEARKALPGLRLTDKEKVDSGEYEWIDVIPKLGAKYKALRKIVKS